MQELEAVASSKGHYAAIKTVPVDAWPSIPKPFVEKALADLRKAAKVTPRLAQWAPRTNSGSVPRTPYYRCHRVSSPSPDGPDAKLYSYFL